MFTIGGSSGIILGNAGIDLGLHDTYYVPGHFHFVLSLGGVIGIFSGIIYFGENIVGYKNLLPSSSCTLSLYHLVLTFIGIVLTFSPMHFLGFNLMPRRIPDFPDSFHSWNFLSSIGSGITFLSFAIFYFSLSFNTVLWLEDSLEMVSKTIDESRKILELLTDRLSISVSLGISCLIRFLRTFDRAPRREKEKEGKVLMEGFLLVKISASQSLVRFHDLWLAKDNRLLNPKSSYERE